MSDDAVHAVEWRRILVDGIVIVASILLAFAINAWWDGRKDRVKEDAYLRMLVVDMQATLRNNATFGHRADSIDWAVARLVRAYYQPIPPTRDSISAWLLLSKAAWVVEPTLGTAQALVSTGDLDLIRDEKTRLQISNYITNMLAFDGFEAEWLADFRSTSAELSRHVDIDALRLSSMSQDGRDASAASDALFPFPAGRLRAEAVPDLQALVRDSDVHRILERMNTDKTNMRIQRARMKDATEKFLKRIDAQIHEQRSGESNSATSGS